MFEKMIVCALLSIKVLPGRYCGTTASVLQQGKPRQWQVGTVAKAFAVRPPGRVVSSTSAELWPRHSEVLLRAHIPLDWRQMGATSEDGRSYPASATPKKPMNAELAIPSRVWPAPRNGV